MQGIADWANAKYKQKRFSRENIDYHFKHHFSVNAKMVAAARKQKEGIDEKEFANMLNIYDMVDTVILIGFLGFIEKFIKNGKVDFDLRDWIKLADIKIKSGEAVEEAIEKWKVKAEDYEMYLRIVMSILSDDQKIEFRNKVQGILVDQGVLEMVDQKALPAKEEK